METSVLVEKLEKLPEPLKKEVSDFIDFLIYKNENFRSMPYFYSEKFEETDNALNRTILNAQPPKFDQKKAKRQFGILKGKIIIADDFDEPLEDFKDYM